MFIHFNIKKSTSKNDSMRAFVLYEQEKYSKKNLLK